MLNSTQLRTSPAFYLLVGGILGAGVVLGVFVALVRTSAAWPPTAILGCLLAAAMSVLLSTKLTLTADAIHYRSLFVRRDVPLADVVGAKFVAGFSSTKPYQRLIVSVRGNSGQKDITVNAGLFNRAEIRRWVDTLNARLT
jgi:hypothetical protein